MGTAISPDLSSAAMKRAEGSGSGTRSGTGLYLYDRCRPSRRDDHTDFDNFAGQIIDTVLVSGNRGTRPRTITRVMASKTGTRLNPDYLERDLSYLYGLGYFSSVRISVREEEESRCVILVRVNERPDLFLKYPYPVIDYDIERGLRYGAKWKVENFRGLGEHISVEFKRRADEDHSAGASWYIPWFLGRRLRFNLNIYNYRKLDEPESNDFIKSRNGVAVRFGFPLTDSFVRQLWFLPSLSLEDRESRLSIPENINYPAGVFFRQSLASAGFSLLYDSRNRNIVPTSGMVSNVYMRYVHSLSGLDQNYAFYEFRHRNFIEISDNDTFILGLDIFNRDGGLPSFFRMKLGGHSDLRGYFSDKKGTSKVLGSLQWRKLVFGPREYDIPWVGKFDLSINLTAFVDTGALAESFSELSGSDFHGAGGGGVEIISPLQNLLRLEYAADANGHGGMYFVSGSRF